MDTSAPSISTVTSASPVFGPNLRFGMDDNSILAKIRTFDGIVDSGIDANNTIYCKYDSKMLDMRDISLFLDYTPRDSGHIKVDGETGGIFELHINQLKPVFTAE